jgi:hypothetical protein
MFSFQYTYIYIYIVLLLLPVRSHHLVLFLFSYTCLFLIEINGTQQTQTYNSVHFLFFRFAHTALVLLVCYTAHVPIVAFSKERKEPSFFSTKKNNGKRFLYTNAMHRDTYVERTLSFCKKN